MPTPTFDYTSMSDIIVQDYQGVRPENTGAKLWLLMHESITAKKQLEEFNQDPSLCNMVYATAHVLKEKLHALGCLKSTLKICSTARAWFTANTVLTGEQSTDNLLRLIVSYAMQAKLWNPPDLHLATGPELPLPFIITTIWFALDPTNGEFLNDQGDEVPALSLLPTPLFPGDIQPVLALPAAKDDAHSPPLQPEPEGDKVPPANMPPSQNGPTTKFISQEDLATKLQPLQDMIQNLHQDLLEQKRSSNQGLNPNAPPHVPQPSRSSDPSSSLIPAAAAHSGAITTHSEPITPVHSGTITPAPVPRMDMDLYQVMEELLRNKKQEKQDHICLAWENNILPYVTCHHVVLVHDFPMNSYGQRASVSAAKTVMELYQKHWEEECPSAHTLPRKIPEGSVFYTLAVKASSALKASMSAHAFPHASKPQMKERTQLLKAVLGSDVSQAELKTAYNQTESWKGKSSKPFQFKPKQGGYQSSYQGGQQQSKPPYTSRRQKANYRSSSPPRSKPWESRDKP